MNAKQRQFLRKRGQTLVARYQIGKLALTEEVLALLDKALLAQELIKIHFLPVAHAQQTTLIETLVEKLAAELVQVIGHRVILYRENPKARKLHLPI
jgi:RNA-binding protein